MALITNELYSQSTRGPLLRIQPANGPGAVKTRVFAGGTAETLPVGTPVYIAAATGFALKCVPSGTPGVTNDIWGIVWPAPITTDASAGTQVHGVVMEMGEIHFDELEALRAAGVFTGSPTPQHLEDMCRKPSNRERGIIITGLDLIGGDAGL